MQRFNRRTALKRAVPVVGASILAGSSLTAADAPSVPEPLIGFPILAGPFNLGELYDDSQEGKEGEGLSDALPLIKGPSRADIAKSLNQCQIYAIDRKTRDKFGEWNFDEEGFPKLAIEGRFIHELRNKAGKKIAMQIAAIVPRGVGTTYRKTEIPFRDFEIMVEVRVSYSGDIVRTSSVYNCFLKRIGYDIHGKILDPIPS